MTRSKRLLRLLAAVTFIAAGANHFRSFAFYRGIIPPIFPTPGALVVISGVAEIVGGGALLIPSLRRLAGWGLIALLLAVFPANIYMATSRHFEAIGMPRWMLLARLPVQAIFIAWVWLVALRRTQNEPNPPAA
jgi:uncharacterized membrane protein